MKWPSDMNPAIFPWAVMKEYPEMCEPGAVYLDIWPITPPLLIALDPDMARQFCQEPSAPKDPLLNKQMFPYTQNLDILNLEGDEWKMWRAIFNPCFSVKNLQALLPDFIEEVELLKDTLRQAAQDGEVIKLDDATMSTGCNVVIRALL